MLKFVTNIPISRRLLLAFLLAAVIPGIVISMLGFTFVREQHNRSQAAQANIYALKTANAANTYLNTIKMLVDDIYQKQYETSIAGTQVQESIDQLHTTDTFFNKAIRDYKQSCQLSTAPQMNEVYMILTTNDPHTPLPGKQQELLNHVLNQSWPGYQASENQLLTASAAKTQRKQVTILFQQVQQQHMLLVADWDQITQMTEESSIKTTRVGPAQTNPIILATLIAFLSTIIVVTTISYIIYLTITRPLDQLMLLTRRVGKGETDARAMINGHDEINQVAQSINHMLDNIVRLMRETQFQRDSLQKQIEKLVSEVSGIGEGDLRVQAEVGTDALGVLADSFNYMLEELGSLVVRVKTMSHEVDSSTVTILDRMTQLVETGNRQISQIGEVEIELERMTTFCRQVAEHAQSLYNVTRVARQDVHIGKDAVIQSSQSMSRISESVHETVDKVQVLGERSHEINEIVEAISSIAHQTNRLALDAAIQAAMAGEHGKAFGAVAADIRRLAERSKDQAGMITRIVRNVREEIGSVIISMQDTERETTVGVQLTRRAGNALEAIFAAVEQQEHEVEHINQVAAVKQVQSANTIVQIMKRVSTSTQQGSSNTQDVSQHMERLARLVEQLRSSVEAFKLRENRGYYVPSTNITIDLENETDTPLTVSGVFRKISLIERSNMGSNAAISRPGFANGSFPPAPLPSTQQQSGWNWNNSVLPVEQLQSSQKAKNGWSNTTESR